MTQLEAQIQVVRDSIKWDLKHGKKCIEKKKWLKEMKTELKKKGGKKNEFF